MPDVRDDPGAAGRNSVSGYVSLPMMKVRGGLLRSALVDQLLFLVAEPLQHIPPLTFASDRDSETARSRYTEPRPRILHHHARQEGTA